MPTAPPKPGRWCSARIRADLPQPPTSVGYPHPKVALRLVDAERPRRRAGRAGNEMPGPDARLSQPAATCRRRSRPTASTAPATCSAATATASTISSAAPTTCSCRAARTSIRATSSACWSAIPPSPRPAWSRSTTTSRARSRSPSSLRRPGERPDADDIKRFALANAPAYQHPRFVWFLDRLPLSSTNKIDRAALKRSAAARLAPPL